MHKYYYSIFIFSLGTLLGITTVHAENLLLDPLAVHLRTFAQTGSTQPPSGQSLHLYSLSATKTFYKQRHFQPAWLGADQQPIMAAFGLLAAVSEAHSHGLRPADYHYSALDQLLRQHQQMTSPQQHAYLEILLTDAWLTYAHHLSFGRLDPRNMGQLWAIPHRRRDLGALLQTALTRGDSIKTLQNLAPKQAGYERLRHGLTHYKALQTQGGWPLVSSGTNLKKGMRHERVKELRARLQMGGDLIPATVAGTVGKITAPLSTNNQETFFDDAVFEAVRTFQTRHGLVADGVVGPRTLQALNVTISERRRQLEINLERWRWLPKDLGNHYIMVNIPGFTMYVVENGRPVMSAPVIVGRPKRPTPTFMGEISHLVFNPHWHVPRTIAIKDKLPMLRQNVSTLSEQGIHLYDAAGQAIDPKTVNWEEVTDTNFNFHLRQDPGPQNALGRVKFMFPNRHHVYLHDTPSRRLFNHPRRAFSSGCIRVSNPLKLAEYLLQNDSRWSHEKILATITSEEQRHVLLPEKVPVYLLYFTASVDATHRIHFQNDIYRHDKLLAQGLGGSALPVKKIALRRSQSL